MKRSTKTALVAGLLAMAIILGVAWDRDPAEPAAGAAVASSVVAASPELTADATRGRQALLPGSRTDLVKGRLQQDGGPLGGCVVELWSGAGRHATTWTDGAGQFTFEQPGAEHARLQVDDPRVPLGWRGDWFGTRVGTVDLGAVEVPVPAVVRGRVRDEAGDAVAGALVSLRTAQVASDAEGRFELVRVMPGEGSVRADATGLRSATQQLDLAVGDVHEVLLVLRAGQVARGVVLDARDRPVAGARVGMQGRVRGGVATDEAGRFELPGLDPDARLQVRTVAQGGVDGARASFTDEMVIRLPEVFALRGHVRGAAAGDTVIQLDSDPAGPLRLPPRYTYELRSPPLPVAADGSFEIRGLAEGSYRVRAVAAGVGRSAWQGVALRGDQGVLLEIQRNVPMIATVVDERGAPMAGVRVRMDDDVAWPSLLASASERELVARLRTGSAGAVEALTDSSGVVELAVPARSPIAVAATRRGRLPAARFFDAGMAPAALRLVLRPDAAIAGVVEGGSPDAFETHVALWRAEDQAVVRENGPALVCDLDATGAFRRDGLEPGRYRVTLMRRNLAFVDPRSGSTPRSLPLIDEGLCRASQLEVEVRVGEVADVVLREAPLGVVEGRVLVAGIPLAGASVTGVRPLPKRSRQRRPDWTWAGEMALHAGQRTDAQGRYRLHYTEAGPVELRVRHPAGHATSPPVVVDLPPPGAPVRQDLAVATGSVQGRFRADLLEGRQEVDMNLVPMDIARRDHLSGDHRQHAMALVLSCADVTVSPGSQSFSFDGLPEGDWLLLATRGTDEVVCRRLVTVNRGVTAVGELRPERGVEVRLQVRVVDGVEPLRGVMLYREHGGDPLGIWIATGRMAADGIEFTNIDPGAYTVWPFAGAPTNPRQAGQAVRIEIDAQGHVTPDRIVIPAK